MKLGGFPWNTEIENASLTLWKYHRLEHRIEPADMVLILGSHDLRVGNRAAELHRQGMAPLFLFTGGVGNWTEGVFERPEAELISERAIDLGLPAELVMTEPNATNTGENIKYSKALLESKGMKIKRAIAIQKPYMERRAHASLTKQWPDVEWQITSPELDFNAYCQGGISKALVTEIMVGDFQRILEYPKLGFQTEQFVDDQARAAYAFLIKKGFDGHLMK